jgi:DNA-binding response OmpR family regulator
MKARILVVDDEETMRRSLADILRLEGYHVSAVSNGTAAIDALKREPFDLMLLDLKMPGIDGLEVFRKATKTAPDTLVIFLTAHGSLESAIEALRYDAFDYLLKPSSPEQIIKSVEAALARRAETEHKRLLISRLDSSIQELLEVGRKEIEPVGSKQSTSIRDGISLDLPRREIYQGDQKVKLTPTEGKLLKVLLDNRGRVLSHRELVQLVQGYDVTEREAPEVLRPLVSRLRHKLAHFPGGDSWINNVRGAGYVLDIENR